MTLTADTVANFTLSIANREELQDPTAKKLLNAIRDYFDLSVDRLKIVKNYSVHHPVTKDISQLFFDPMLEEVVEQEDADWSVTVSLKRGMTDNTANSVKITVEDYLSETVESVTTSIEYRFWGGLKRHELERIAKELLANTLIHDIRIKAASQEVNLDISDAELMQLSRERQLALNLNEMRAIREGLGRNPTDVELEALAQTWSEHCKHKIFAAKITYREGDSVQEIDGIFKTYIKGATDQLKRSWLISVFTDNAGIISLNDNQHLAFKVETHNSPSALDPYGGALTGILGVNRDIMGAGYGARLLANTNVFCFAPPDYGQPIPKRLHHPKRVLEGVRLGVEHGGNKSGVPTVNGSLYFDERYLGKPLVYCGSVGIMPREINGRLSHVKEIVPGDLIVIAGGRTGRDGIHGATFSSEELHEESPSSAVQIGDPFTQKKLHDFLIDARDQGLYRTVTDNGAGGFSSSVGELAELSGGCEIHLDRAPLKQHDLEPWEILVSESQERMTFAVAEGCWEKLKELAQLHEVEIAEIGTFTDSGQFHILYHQKTVGNIALEFLHNGVPRLELEAVWEQPKPPKQKHKSIHEWLRDYTVCSKESIVRQYDHEVQGGSVVKPMVGKACDGPSDAAVFFATEDPSKGIILSHGLCPGLSDVDAYDMAANAVDEAVRNAVAVGANPDFLAILDNFCWPDPVFDPDKNPDGKYKLAQLVRANRALYDAALAFGTPIISGKDSMKNDYHVAGIKISIPPTLLISAIGVIGNVTQVTTMDVKVAGDLVYIVGETRDSYSVDFTSALKNYRALHRAIASGLVASCHDCSEGGIAVALAEKSIAGRLGIEANVDQPFTECPSRLLVTVDPKKRDTFEDIVPAALLIGEVRGDDRFILGDIDETVDALRASWQGRL